MRKLKTVAAVVAGLVLPAMAAPVLTVTQGDGSISVSVPAGAADGESALYLVWDTTDHGTDINDWPSENRIAYEGDLSAAAGTYAIPTDGLPENYCARAIVAKTVDVVDSIRLGQNRSYANTGISATSVYGIDIKYRLSSELSFSSNTGHVLIGGEVDNGNIAQWGTRKDSYMRWNNKDCNYVFPGLFSSTDVKTISVKDGKAYVNGSECSVPSGYGPISGTLGSVNKTVLLSAGWTKNNTTVERYMDAYWYAATLYGNDGSALVDLVPAKEGDTPKFYNKVSHKYIGITGTATASGDVVATEFALASSAVMSSVTTATWTGNGDTALLSDAGNWTPGLPGAFANPVTINASDEKHSVVPSGTTAYGKFLVGDRSNGTLEQSEGAITASAVNGAVIGVNGGTGTYTMTGGTLTTTYSGIADDALYVGSDGGTGHLEVGGDSRVELKHKLNIGFKNNSKGYLTISGNGEVNCGGDVNIGTWENGCYGEVIQSDGTLKVTGAHVHVAQYGTGKYTLSGGKLTVVDGSVHVGHHADSRGTMKQSGGEIYIMKENLSVGGEAGTSRSGVGDFEMEGGKVTVGQFTHIGAVGTGTFTQSGGTMICNNWTAIGRQSGGVGYCTVTGGSFTVKDSAGLNIGEGGNGTLTIGNTGIVTAGYGIQLGANSGSAGTLKLQENGKIVTKYIKKGNGSATLVEFDGGTIQATTADANILDGLGNIVLKSGGVTIDTQGKNLVINNCTFNVEAGGKITVTGGGTVTFTNCTVSLSESVSGAVVFAEAEDGKFSNTPTLAGNRKIRISDDGKMIKIVPPGFIILFR